MPISIANTYQSNYDWKAESDKLKFSDTFIDNSVDESLTTKERIPVSYTHLTLPTILRV